MKISVFRRFIIDFKSENNLVEIFEIEGDNLSTLAYMIGFDRVRSITNDN